VFSWILWPSRVARDDGMKKVMADPRLKPDVGPTPFDGKRLISARQGQAGELWAGSCDATCAKWGSAPTGRENACGRRAEAALKCSGESASAAAQVTMPTRSFLGN
jgi:hypothetical protein